MDLNKQNFNSSDYIPYILIAVIVISYVIFFVYSSKPIDKDESIESESEEEEEIS